MLDCLFINPPTSALYQGLSKDFSAKEPGIWHLMLANSVKTQGYSADYLDVEADGLDYSQAVDAIKVKNPRLVVFICTGQNPNASSSAMAGGTKLAKLLKQEWHDCKICFGGPHPNALIMETLAFEYIDIVLTNEGVYPLWNLLASDFKDSSLAKINGIAYKDKDLVPHLNPPEKIVPQDRLEYDLPGVDFSLLGDVKRYRTSTWHTNFHENNTSPFISLYTSLGCPYQCSFCMINIINRTNNDSNKAAADFNIFRHWKPETIITWFDKLADLGVKNIKLADELFSNRPKHCVALAKLLGERKYHQNIWAYTRVNTVLESYLEWYKKAGINWLAIGIECIDANSIILTNRGLKKIKDICINDEVMSYDRDTNKFVMNRITKLHNKKERTLKISTGTLDLISSKTHRYFTIDNITGSLEEKFAKDIKVGDDVAATHVDGLDYGHTDIEPDLAQLIGFIIGDGHIDTYNVRITGHVDFGYLLEKYSAIATKYFDDLKSSMVIRKSRPNNYELTLTSKKLNKYLIDIGLGGTLSHTKRTPIIIQAANNKVISAYIAGLWDSDGSVYFNEAKSRHSYSNYISFNNKKLLEEVKFLLLYRLGIQSSRIKTIKDKRYEDKYQHYLVLKRKDSNIKFYKKIPLLHEKKYNYLKRFVDSYGVKSDVLIRVPKNVIDDITQTFNWKARELDREYGTNIHQMCCSRTTNERVTYHKFKKVIEYVDKNNIFISNAYNNFVSLIESGVSFEKVRKVEHLEKQDVYDITVEGTHTYLANGFLVHNSGSSAIRTEITKGRFKEENIRDIIGRIKQYDINVGGNFLVGTSHLETQQTMQETLDLALELQCENMNVYAAMCLPGSPLFLKARERGWEMPTSFEQYGFLSYECLPVPSDTLTAAEILQFRDDFFQRYFTDPTFLSMIHGKFGQKAVDSINKMVAIPLRRKILGHEPL